VLISMGILALGLLGVAALFPVGGYYMQKAEIADRGSAIAQQAMNDLVARGMLNPEAWQVLVPSPPLTGGIEGAAKTFARPVGPAMAREMTLPAYTDRPKYLAQRFGSAFVIDPMGIAATTVTAGSNANKLVSPFPAAAYSSPKSYVSKYFSSPNSPWNTWDCDPPENWPVRRITYHQPDPTLPPLYGVRMTAPLAEAYFSGRDDLTADLPDRSDQPAIQLWDVTDLGNGPTPLARQWTGDYSWIATVVPTTSAAQMALGQNANSYEYDVSVVMFYKRAIPRTSPLTQAAAVAAGTDLYGQEQAFRARVVSTGLSGGEMLLEVLDSTVAIPFQQLKVGQWIMLCGPHPASHDADPRFVLKWYQVTSIDEEEDAGGVLTDSNTQRLVTLRGSQWPWEPVAVKDLKDNSLLSNSLCVGILPGAVAVHTKTLRLEGNSPWSME
jgi:hypothetical protein